MKRGYALYIFFFILLTFFCSCESSELSKGKAKDIIREHFEDYYGQPIPNEIESLWGGGILYKRVLIAKKIGLITDKQISSARGSPAQGHGIEKPYDYDKFSITLTQKGSSNPHHTLNDGSTWFLIGKRIIDDIVDIKKVEDKRFQVLFSFIYQPNKLQEEWSSAARDFGLKPTTIEKTKLRGRAYMFYDAFLKKYEVQSIEWSPWEKENWRGAVWIKKGKDNFINIMYPSD